MVRKKGYNYFDAFVELVQYSCEAATLLNKTVNGFKLDNFEEIMTQMHDIEHAGDMGKHQLMKKLAREFITPIEREDIMALTDAIDNVTDTIEDVLMCIYMFNIVKIRKDAAEMTEIIVKCCEALKEAMQEFGNFRKSQTLHSLIVEINRLEEEGDALFIKATRNLYVEKVDPVEIIAWGQTFKYLEKCCDACEDVSEVIESVRMKNS